MATLIYKGKPLKVRVTHNVLSEFISLRGTTFSDVMKVLASDPIGWTRDMLYCSLFVYDPDALDGMTRYDVGDEMMKIGTPNVTKFTKDLVEDFSVKILNDGNKIPSKNGKK